MPMLFEVIVVCCGCEDELLVRAAMRVNRDFVMEIDKASITNAVANSGSGWFRVRTNQDWDWACSPCAGASCDVLSDGAVPIRPTGSKLRPVHGRIT